MHIHPSVDSFLNHVSSGCLVLTPNQRLARSLSQSYDQSKMGHGPAVWRGARFLSIRLWLSELCVASQLRGLGEYSNLMTLSQIQDQRLWRMAVTSSPSIEELMSSEAIATLSSEAWKWLRQYHCPLDSIDGDTAELKLLKTVIAQYKLLCSQNNSVDEVDAIQEVLNHLGMLSDLIPSQVLSIGFDELGPIEKTLFEHLKELPCSFKQHEIQVESKVQRQAFGHWEQELEYVACWAAGLLQGDTGLKVGVVVPDLADKRAAVERIFDKVFEPQKISLNETRHSPLYTISAGQPLVQMPLIASAFDLLGLNRQTIDRALLTKLAYSRFWDGASDFALMQQLVRELKQDFIRVPIAELRARLADKKERGHLLLDGLAKFERYRLESSNKKKTFFEWAEVFTLQLQCLGWPGPSELDTYEYQQLSQWPQLTQQISSLDEVSEKVTFEEAFETLKRSAYVPFHAQSADSPLQILGTLEAAGQIYDQLWVVGLDARVWPEPIKPNPLLPLHFQKHAGMPRSSNDRELVIAKNLTERFAHSAAMVVFSHCTSDGDQPLVVSPLIASYPIAEWAGEQVDVKQDFVRNVKREQLEFFQDDCAPPVHISADVKGGVKAIKEQAACPFRAFARMRLFAENTNVLEEGVSALLRGNLLHKALEFLWNRVRTQEALLSFSEQEVRSIVNESIKAAWSALPEAKRLGDQFRQIESDRNESLLMHWLELEKQREPFSVEDTENEASLTLAGLPLRFRFDRIDRVSPDGDLFVIDYKSGEVDIKRWLDERPEEPQVPLYCLALRDKRLVGAGFAQINRRETALKGIAERVEYAPGITLPEDLSSVEGSLTWEGLITQWDRVLQTLAMDYLSGRAEVDPKATSTCAYCDLASLCRIADQRKGAFK